MLRPPPFALAPAGKTRSRERQPTAYGYTRVSTGGQSVAEQVRQLPRRRRGARLWGLGSGAAVDRPQLRRLLSEVAPGDIVMVTRLDRLARSTRDLLNTLAAVADRKAGFRSLDDAWADTTTRPAG
jgi:DNA invertase Pin-like site-specific DNA recombinase